MFFPSPSLPLFASFFSSELMEIFIFHRKKLVLFFIPHFTVFPCLFSGIDDDFAAVICWWKKTVIWRASYISAIYV
jgi:hypothetical protein